MDHTYKEKEMNLLQALIERNGMQHIIDTAAEAFGNPVFVCDLGYKIICYSDHDAVYDDFWEHMKNHNYSIPEQISQIMRTGDFAKIYASDDTRIGKYPFTDSPFLAARIRDGSHVLGHICVYGCRETFSEQDRELLILLCKIVSYEMLYRGMSTPLKIPYYTLLTDLLEGTLSDKEELNMRLQCLKISFPPKMHLAVISFQSRVLQASIFYIREYLMQKLPHTLSIVYQERLILLLPRDYLEDDRIEKFLATYKANIDYKIGVSNPFSDAVNLKIYYEQALAAIQIAGLLKLEDRLCLYQRLYIYQILLYARKETDLKFLCDPAVLNMQAYDRLHHTEYLKDLELYLSYGKNINKAAQKACVHKNSMYYRISKMEEKFSISLEDEETCFSLQLSLKILHLLDC
ncbi:MAG: helix-turn-helix domain-containing protein [Eubacteriales bacterium]|nr:helix-turn-helix domain-containing protein [Eubacteriales bacterium]